MFALRVAARLVRRVLVRSVSILVAHPVSALIIVALLGFIVYTETGRPMVQAASVQPALAAASVSATPDSQLGERSAAAEKWIEGYRTFNAGLVWEVLGDSMKTELQSRGESQATLQQRMDQVKSSGSWLEKADYVGRYDLGGGRFVAFYVLIVHDDATGNHAYTPYAFSVGPDGKLTSVD